MSKRQKLIDNVEINVFVAIYLVAWSYFWQNFITLYTAKANTSTDVANVTTYTRGKKLGFYKTIRCFVLS